MKSSKLLIAALTGALLTGTSSCQKDLLDTVNPNEPSSEQFWQTEQDAVRASTALYSPLQYFSTYSLGWHFATEGRSDESWTRTPALDLNQFLTFRQANTTDRSQVIWNDFYRAIFRCNQVLTKVPGIQMDETVKKRVLAQAYFVRGLCYYELGLLFGNVPLVTTLADASTRVPQGNVQQVQAQVIADMQAAKAGLPLASEWGPADKGRATRGAATAYLGKVYMQQKEWALASAQFAEIISSNQYRLVDNYQDNFTEFNENNSESIFEIQFEGSSKLPAVGVDIAGGSEGQERSQFWGPPGFGFTDVDVRPWVFREFRDRTATGAIDPRRDVSVYSAVGTPLVYGRPYTDPSRYLWRKYQNDPRPGGAFFEDFHSGINIRLVRLADVLLMQAEALNEQGQPEAALPLINQVRGRASVRVVPLTGTFTKETMRLQLRHERVTELAGEGVRWSDINRYGLLDSQEEVDKLARADHDPDFLNFVVGKNRLLPIPQTEIDIDRNLKQNPGF
ncbi:RagB/SusD family nutrient uptake outer membrane protein [Hymenobacter metallicola]|uniref:RagB/SusD family nutrient uptake outer membrane protein n=1 Tax=Hymenobacter metallicola TaxID=2563114 RepID=A0A4Z0QKC9_9BACT|nr:RagB/SusD family nutrient uptake outer membrane protein [Hymenobacter metallicola]TGE29172.1 RagB/SusD family nutrient uptake outer membrane protein [Hymenobacter metallicola]